MRLEQENKRKRQNELKKSMHYKDATSYKSFHEGTSNYLNLVDYYQQEKLKENQKMLENLGGDKFDSQKIDENYNSFKKDPKNKNEEIDLAFYENKKNGKDNIKGLKEAVKYLITESKDKKVTKILKDLLAKISPIIDTDGEALKSYGLNTRYDELLEKYDNLKNGFENSEAEAEAKRKKAKEEAEKEAQKKAKEKAEKKENNNTSEKPKQKFLTDEQNNLMVRLFPKQARELGLKLILKPGEKEEEEQPLPQEEMPAPTPEEQREIIKKMTFSNLSEKVENKSDKSIENANNFAAKYFSTEYKKAYEEIKKNENNIPEAPAVPNALKKLNDNDNDEDDNDSDENENIKTPEEMINEYKGEEDIKEKQYEYELFRTDYINKIESEISYSAGLINHIISEEKAKEDAKEKAKEIEKQKKAEKKAKKGNITESLNNDDKKSDTTKNEATDQNNNKTNINTDICKFLLKLLRQKEESINTSKIKDIFITHTMFNTLSKNKNMTPEDILDFIFKDDSDDYYNPSYDDEDTINTFTFARFLFRLYYTVSNGVKANELNNPDKRGPQQLNENTKFTEPYQNLINGKAKNDKELQRKSLDELLKLINEKISNKDEPNKDEPNKDIYEKMANYIRRLRDGEKIKMDNSQIKDLISNYSDKLLKDNIKIDAPIFKDNYFKIDEKIDKIANQMSTTNNKGNK